MQKHIAFDRQASQRNEDIALRTFARSSMQEKMRVDRDAQIKHIIRDVTCVFVIVACIAHVCACVVSMTPVSQ